MALARLSWHYGPISLPASAPFEQSRLVQHGGVLLQLVRNRAAEERAAYTIRQTGLSRISHNRYLPESHQEAKRGLAGSGIVILDALLKLRQACCDPRLLKLAVAKAAKARSAKLDRLLEMPRTGGECCCFRNSPPCWP